MPEQISVSSFCSQHVASTSIIVQAPECYSQVSCVGLQQHGKCEFNPIKAQLILINEAILLIRVGQVVPYDWTLFDYLWASWWTRRARALWGRLRFRVALFHQTLKVHHY
jgi:hypothetical protein